MNFIQKRENRIYHYCNLHTALKLILPRYELLLAPIQKTNDPRENKGFYFKHYNSPFSNPSDLLKIQEEFSDVIRDGCKVLCFCQDYKIYWGSLLSKMWAHYGGNHEGICLELDKTEFINENAKKFDFDLFKEIFYFEFNHNHPPESKSIDHKIIQHIGKEEYFKNKFRKTYVDYLFFTKNSEWESECEIRLLHFSDTAQNEYCSIKKSLKNIHLGINFDNSNLQSVKNLIEGTDIRIIGTDYGDFGLIFKNPD